MDQMESRQRRQCDPRPGTTDLYGNLCKRQGFPGGSVRKEPACNVGDTETQARSLSGEVPGRREWCPPQDPCLGNPLGSRVWWGTVHGVTRELDKTEQRSTQANETVPF